VNNEQTNLQRVLVPPRGAPHVHAGLRSPVVVSLILATRNRRETVLDTLDKLESPFLCQTGREIIVVDNASTDGTPATLADRFPGLRVIRSANNLGACAKNLALPLARGEFIVFLDDDSYPEPGAIDAMVRQFKSDPKLGAISFAVTLPSGVGECSAYPTVFVGCGVGLRKSALDQVGGLPDDFFMQAEEYDLSLRLLAAGWRVRRCPDLRVAHKKSPVARISDRTMRLDVRNNLLLIARYFPSRWMWRYARDWMMRYALIAKSTGQRGVFWRGLAEGILRAPMQPRSPLSGRVFEEFSKVAEIANRLDYMRRFEGIRQVVLVDLGKNIFPYLRGARRCGMTVVAIADNRLGGKNFRFRGIPVLTDQAAGRLEFDAAIISNYSIVHAEQRRRQWKALQHRPVFDLLECSVIVRCMAA
jgi:N-acetylglucosaminyl-diphospho-decaprenol L-rhamnosyltransferase